MKSVLKLPQVLRFVWHHPLSRQRRLSRLGRYVAWQIGARLVPGPVAAPFVNGTRMLVRPGMNGATGNIYTGLHDYREMAFVLHTLRMRDLFVDVGANVGAYTLLAAGAVGCRCISVEPARNTFAQLVDNVQLNRLEDRVEAHLMALGEADGEVSITDSLDTMNRVVPIDEPASDMSTSRVPMTSLDALVGDRTPTIVKIDVEGFEEQVLAGAQATLARPTMLAAIVETNRQGVGAGNQFAQLAGQMRLFGFAPYDYDASSRRITPITGRSSNHANTIFVRSAERLLNRLSTAPRFRVIDVDV